MNKQEFINAFCKKADFLTADEVETVKQYLYDSLSENDSFTDVDAFIDNMRLSFDIFKHLTQADAQRQASALGESVSELMESDNMGTTSNGEKGPDSANEQCEQTYGAAFDNKRILTNGGLAELISKKKGIKRVAAIGICVIVFILLLPVIGIMASVCAALYLIPLSAVLLVWLFIMLIDAAFALLGTVATSYGIANLFITTPVGLMEIGLGTVLFAFMLAVWALNYQFIAFIIPRVCKKVTRLLRSVLKLPKELIFGKAVTEQ